MKVEWSREVYTWGQYFVFTFAAATAALLYQAADDFDRTGDLNDGMAVCFTYAEVVKGSGVYYGWLLGVFVALSAARFFILFVLGRIGMKLP